MSIKSLRFPGRSQTKSPQVRPRGHFRRDASGRRKRCYEVERLTAQATGEDARDKLGRRGHSSTPGGPFRAARNGTNKP